MVLLVDVEIVLEKVPVLVVEAVDTTIGKYFIIYIVPVDDVLREVVESVMEVVTKKKSK